jgi:TspO/MBR family
VCTFTVPFLCMSLLTLLYSFYYLLQCLPQVISKSASPATAASTLLTAASTLPAASAVAVISWALLPPGNGFAASATGGITAALIMRAPQALRAPELQAYCWHFTLLQLWGVVFLRLRRPDIAFGVMLAIVASAAALLYVWWDVSRSAVMLLVPYAVWLSYLAWMSGYMWLHNSREAIEQAALEAEREAGAVSCAKAEALRSHAMPFVVCSGEDADSGEEGDNDASSSFERDPCDEVDVAQTVTDEKRHGLAKPPLSPRC